MLYEWVTIRLITEPPLSVSLSANDLAVLKLLFKNIDILFRSTSNFLIFENHPFGHFSIVGSGDSKVRIFYQKQNKFAGRISMSEIAGPKGLIQA